MLSNDDLDRVLGPVGGPPGRPGIDPGPVMASLVIAELGGYGVLFGTAGVITVLGAVSVARIRSVR